ncbi:trans-aconitate 2-methyltransferase [uncultured Ramlibacter sp.]|uniref:class I SAM-dependent methyltransferase n=1 Tax=uncultured Ramlibacter sp. TaxID=260755 RepID=UPI00262B53CF|nr:class I SAM-dependent methyltransferase [uncultured Ramlibacter sp.]
MAAAARAGEAAPRQAQALRGQIGRYYTDQLDAHGPTPRGVDWSCASSQHLRFAQLLRICEPARKKFSLNDFGCGYGELLRHLGGAPSTTAKIDYLGIDLSPTMVEAARRLHPDAAFAAGHTSPRTADYTVASGVFNVKLRCGQARWIRHIEDCLRQLFETSRHGLAFNLLAPWPAHMAQSSALFRAQPQPWIAFCEEALGGQVELLAGYGLGEYTLLVRRSR